MIEVTGNLWEYPCDARVITTNGTIKKNGACVMGRGCAKEALDRYPLIDFYLGMLVNTYGNRVQVISNFSGYQPKHPAMVAYPVKDNWWENAYLSIIQQSAVDLLALADEFKWQTVVLPRPGCGNGNLSWELVKPMITFLDDRFHVITFDAKA